LEGVLVPEVWIALADQTGIAELRLTTRDIADYDELMRYRLRLLDTHGLRLPDLQAVIATLAPLPGAEAFVAWLERHFQVIVLSDTFYDFAHPLMAQLGFPVLFCHSLVTDDSGRIADYRLRLPNQKRAAVEAFQALRFPVFAAGDSYNDTAMLLAADSGFLFRPPANVVAEFPQLPVSQTYTELAGCLRSASSRRLGDFQPVASAV
jgi:phosphoserine/homoserine phosphotransferase